MATAASITPVANTKILHIALWVVQLGLALFFGMVGLMKTTTPIATLAQQMPWVADAPALIRFIGISELAGAIGLVLPAATRIKPGLTSLAALGLVVIMVLAAIFHLVRGELPAIATNFVIGATAAFVAWGRSKRAPIVAR
jgi:putative oxidoreductase